MAEKKIQENPLPDMAEPSPDPDKTKEMSTKPVPDKPHATVLPPPALSPSNRITVQGLTKMEPNDLYRKLLPGVLFVLTFVTVMTMLLIYMDTVALGAAQFRLNMSRDYELANIPQGSAPLVAYVRQLHLAPRPPVVPPPEPQPTPSVFVLDRVLGKIYNGSFVEFLPTGPRAASTLYLGAARGWRGVALRAAARDFLALAGARAALACLSPSPHPREVATRGAGAFRSRVLCLPLYTVLLAAELPEPHYVLLAGAAALPALKHVPYDRVRLRVIEVQSTDPVYRNQTTDFLVTKNYTLVAEFDDSVMYALNDHSPPLLTEL